MAAVAPAKVELPVHSGQSRFQRLIGSNHLFLPLPGSNFRCFARRNSPLKTVCTVAKYDPMGTTIMAKVKARSFRMTSLLHVLEIWIQGKWRGGAGGRSSSRGQKVASAEGASHVGTAGLISDCWLAGGLAPTKSSLSRMVFSVDIILRVAILKRQFPEWFDANVDWGRRWWKGGSEVTQDGEG